MAWLVVAVMAAMLTCAAGGLIKVGGKDGWAQNVNYTEWATHNRFYVGDWLDFVFDKHYYSVLEVNQTNYDKCNDVGFIKNITRGGRDVYQLTEARPYYFMSSGGYCYQGMKLAINVVKFVAPPPTPSPAKNGASPKSNGNLVIMSVLILVLAFIFRFTF